MSVRKSNHHYRKGNSMFNGKFVAGMEVIGGAGIGLNHPVKVEYNGATVEFDSANDEMILTATIHANNVVDAMEVARRMSANLPRLDLSQFGVFAVQAGNRWEVMEVTPA